MYNQNLFSLYFVKYSSYQKENVSNFVDLIEIYISAT